MEDTLLDDLAKSVDSVEASLTELSNLLNDNFDLSTIPHCDRDLNQSDIGSKIKIAKFLLLVGRKFC